MKLLKSTTATFAIAIALPAGAAYAQQAPEEIIVTAQKRAEKISDVPISMSALSGDELRRRGINSALDLALTVPGLAVGQNTGDGDFAFISLRSVSMRDFADTNESPSAVYIDDFYKANLMGLDGQTFDVDRVEVLRGPQGTLYGRNATGGLIKYVTRKPGDKWEGYFNGTYGSYNEAKVEAAAGGPVSDNVGIRAAVLEHRYDGYFTNIAPGRPNGNGLNTTAARGQIEVKTSDRFTASLMMQYYYNSNDGNLFAHKVVFVNPDGLAQDNLNPAATDSFGYREPTRADPRFSNSDRATKLEVGQFTTTGKLEWVGDAFTVTSITGFERTYKNGVSDSDSTPIDIRGTEVRPRGKQFSEELRVAGETGPAKWLAGFYYFDYQIHGWQRRYRGPVIGYRPLVLYDMKTKSYAGFANVDFALAEGLTLTGGIRYTNEKKNYSLNNGEFAFVFNESTVGGLAKQDNNNVSFNGRVSYKFDGSTLIYAGVSRAYKGGTFNVGYTAIPVGAVSVRPERLTSYEAGLKTSLFNNMLSFDTSVFHYDYKDSQAFQYDGLLGSATTFNRDAKVTGAEVEAHLRPVEGLELGFLGSYLDAKLKRVNMPAGGAVRDTQMPLAPKWTITGLIDYRFPAPWGGTLSVGGDVTYKSSQYFDAFNSPHHFEPSYSVANAQIAWTDPAEKLEISVFAKNLTDTIYRTYSFDLSVSLLATDIYGKPQWFGGSIAYKF